MSKAKTLNFTVGSDEKGARLDVFLKSKISEVSREKIKRAILKNAVLVDGKEVVGPSFAVSAGQKVEITIDTEPFRLQPEKMELEKIYEDENFLVINKPAGLVVHPGANVTSGTVANALLYNYPQIAGLGHDFRPGIIHRLDKETSGLLLIAKTEAGFTYGKKLFKERKILKEYETLLTGKLEPKFGLIEKPLLLAPEKRKVVVSEEGRPAKTEYRVLRYYSGHSDTFGNSDRDLDFYTLVRVILHTGRTHQIRVHFSSVVHPVAGDDTYGAGFPSPTGLQRQFLHAKRLMFKLPNGTTLDLEAPLPKDLQHVLDNLHRIHE